MALVGEVKKCIATEFPPHLSIKKLHLFYCLSTYKKNIFKKVC